MIPKTKIQFKRDTEANWTSGNPVLSLGEPGYETDTGKLKIGDGVTAWNSLEYSGESPVTSSDIVDATAAGRDLLTAVDAEAQAALLAAYIGGGGLGDTDSYIIAQPGDNLIVKYAAAKLLTPNGAALSATNRATLLIMPGIYQLSATLTCDANFVDVIGLGAGEKDPRVLLTVNSIFVTANNVSIQGIRIAENVSGSGNQFGVAAQADFTGVTGTESNNRITITGHGLAVGDVVRFTARTGGTGLSNQVRYRVTIVEADYFLLDANFTTDITAGTLAVDNNTRQVFTNCTGENNSFGGGYSTASGTFINCTGGNDCFGGMWGAASGTFINCTGRDDCFGGSGMGTASGTFINCTGGSSSFGGNSGMGTASGTFTNCICTGSGFAALGTASGTFINCTGGDDSFGGGGIDGILSGKLYWCRLTSGDFQTVSGTGQTRMCLTGTNVENNQG
jgi:hypothetical protein